MKDRLRPHAQYSGWEVMTDRSGHQLSRKLSFLWHSPEKFVHRHRGLGMLLCEIWLVLLVSPGCSSSWYSVKREKVTAEKELESERCWGLLLWDRLGQAFGPCHLSQIPVNRVIKLDKAAADISYPIKHVKPLTEMNCLQMLTHCWWRRLTARGRSNKGF